MRFNRTVNAPAPIVWDVLSDHALYADAAPNLARVDVVDGEGAALTRRCVDTNGNTWTESCTWWEPGEGFGVRVDVDDSGFHRRLFSRFEGEWKMAETPDGIEITIAFEFTTRYGPFGRLITWFFSRKAPGIVERIFDRWETAIDAQRPFDAPDSSRVDSKRPTRETNALYP